MEAYAAGRVDRFAVWVHESDRVMRADLQRRGYAFAESTRAMSVVLDDIRIPRPNAELGPSDWEEHRRIAGLPCDVLTKADRSRFHLLVAQLDEENVATAIALDHEGDCGIYDVATAEPARRRGLATKLTALHLYEARTRGCRIASVQSTPGAERLYAAVGFHNLGRILEYAPPRY